MAPHGKPGEDYDSSRHRMVIYIPDSFSGPERKLMRKFSKPILVYRLYFILPSEREYFQIPWNTYQVLIAKMTKSLTSI